MTQLLDPPVPAGGLPELYEVVNGEVREVRPMGALNSLLSFFLGKELDNFGIEHGRATTETLFRLGPGLPQRRPDVAFLRYERWPFAEYPQADPNALDAVPNIAVEVVSPTNTVEEMTDRRFEYFQAGVQLVWVVEPRRRLISAYTSPTAVAVLDEGGELSGEPALPGFRLSVRALFNSVVRPAGPPPSAGA